MNFLVRFVVQTGEKNLENEKKSGRKFSCLTCSSDALEVPLAKVTVLVPNVPTIDADDDDDNCDDKIPPFWPAFCDLFGDVCCAVT